MDGLEMIISDNEPDMMILTEVIPKAQQNPIHETQIKITGYEHYCNFNFSDVNLGASGIRGVIIYVKDTLKCDEIRFESKYDDHVWVKINLKNKDSLLCGCIYRFPTKEKIITKITTTRVCQVIKEAVQMKYSHLLICGDFNYPEIDWKYEYVDESTEIKQFINTVQACHLYQHIFQPTRCRKGNKPSLLDLILTSEDGMVSAVIHNLGIGESDHECLVFTLHCYKEEGRGIVNRPNNYKADFGTINDSLNLLNWSSELNGDFSVGYRNFTNLLGKATEGCIPNYCSPRKKKNIYLTPEAVRKKDLKNKLWRRYKNSKCEYDHKRFTRVKNDLRSLTRKLRLQFEYNIVHDIKASPKKFWSYVKSKTKTTSKIPSLRKADGTIAETALEKAELLNNFFSSTFTDEKLQNIPTVNLDPFLGEYLNKFIISRDMVQKKLEQLNPGKTPGPDE